MAKSSLKTRTESGMKINNTFNPESNRPRKRQEVYASEWMILTRGFEYRDDALANIRWISKRFVSLVPPPHISQGGKKIPPPCANARLLVRLRIHSCHWLASGLVWRLVGNWKDTGHRDGEKGENGGERRDERDGFMCLVRCRGEIRLARGRTCTMRMPRASVNAQSTDYHRGAYS